MVVWCSGLRVSVLAQSNFFVFSLQGLSHYSKPVVLCYFLYIYKTKHLRAGLSQIHKAVYFDAVGARVVNHRERRVVVCATCLMRMRVIDHNSIEVDTLAVHAPLAARSTSRAGPSASPRRARTCASARTRAASRPRHHKFSKVSGLVHGNAHYMKGPQSVLLRIYAWRWRVESGLP